jgi:hypothetical protein
MAAHALVKRTPSTRRSLCSARHRPAGTLSLPARRFPPPWTVEDTDACFIVRDHNGQTLAYVYFEEEAGRRAAAHLLTRDEARRIAANIAELPELVKRRTMGRRRLRAAADARARVRFVRHGP